MKYIAVVQAGLCHWLEPASILLWLQGAVLADEAAQLSRTGQEQGRGRRER